MGFDWDGQPKALQIALQHIENSHNAKSKADVYIRIWKDIIDKLRLNREKAPSVSAITTRLTSTVKSYRTDPDYGLGDLWSYGVRILNLSQIPGCVITPNPNRQPVNTSVSIALTNRSSTQVEDIEEQTPKQSQSEKGQCTKKRTSEAVNDAEQPRAKRARNDENVKTRKRRNDELKEDLQPIPKRIRHTKRSDGKIEATSSLKLKLITMDNNLNDSEQSGDTTGDHTDSEVSELDVGDDEFARPEDSLDDQSKTTAKSTEMQSKEGKTNDVDKSSNEEIDEFEESEHEELSVENSNNHEKPRVRKVSDAAKSRITMQPPLCLKTGKGQADGHVTSGQRKTRALNEDISLTTEESNDTYISEYPPNCHMPQNRVLHTMDRLMRYIESAVRNELEKRKIDGTMPFRLDETAFSSSALKVIHLIFGRRCNLSKLRKELDEVQVDRRLEFSTFLKAFIGASVTLNVFEKPPLVNVNQNSAEWKLFRLLIDNIVTRPSVRKEPGFYEEGARESAYQFAVFNHIHRDYIPTIGARAASLAREMRSQIRALFPAAPPPTRYFSILRGTWPEPPIDEEYELGRRTTEYAPVPLPPRRYHTPTPSEAENMDENDNESDTERDENAPGKPDEFLDTLTEIYEVALTARAEWEAMGRAIWSFKFPPYKSAYIYGEQFSNEDTVDIRKDHTVFVTTLPAVWAQTRPSPHLPWDKSRCVSMASVYILDPKRYKEGWISRPQGGAVNL